MHTAALHGDHATIRALAAAGADLDATGEALLEEDLPATSTPLIFAAGSGLGASAATVRLLLGLGASPTPDARALAHAGHRRGLQFGRRRAGALAARSRREPNPAWAPEAARAWDPLRATASDGRLRVVRLIVLMARKPA